MILSASLCARMLGGQIFLNKYRITLSKPFTATSLLTRLLPEQAAKTKQKNPLFLLQDEKVIRVGMKEISETLPFCETHMTDGSSGYEAPPHNGRHLTCQST